MKILYFLFFIASFSSAFSQSQLGNAYSGNNINAPAQAIQTNLFVNTGNLNNDNNSDLNKYNGNNPLQQ